MDFAPALPESPAAASGGAILLGRWPSQVYLRFAAEHSYTQPGAQYQFIHWNGRKWQTIRADPALKGLEPFDIFDWYDGASLVTQIQKWHHAVTYRVAPFLVWGKSSHAPPDFSTLPFPKGNEDRGGGRVVYAALPTHEVFVLHNQETHDGRTMITVGYSTRDGALVMDHLMNTDGGVIGQFSTGRLGQRDVVVAWGDVEQVGKRRSWLQLYDGTSSTKLPVPEPDNSQEGLGGVWLAGGKIWARGSHGLKIWQFDGTSWSAFARSAQAGAELAWSTEDGSLWGDYLPDVFRFEKEGRRVSVPFLAEPTTEIYGLRLFVAAPDDIWLFVAAEDGDMIFRTKKMTSILACD